MEIQSLRFPTTHPRRSRSLVTGIVSSGRHGRALQWWTAVGTVARANLRIPERPDRLARAVLALRPWGVTFAGGVAASAARYPGLAAVIDEEGGTTYRQLWERSGAVAGALAEQGIGPGATIGILCTNHRGMVEATLASARVGADIVLVNTGMAGPQVADVTIAEKIDVLIHDDELTDLAEASGAVSLLAEHSIARLAAASRPRLRPRPAGRIVILTSGTTGRPKGAARRSAGALAGTAAILGTVPLRSGDVSVVAAPLFHGWGLSQLMVNLSLSSTTILHRRFDPTATLQAVATHRATVVALVPVMLQRILALGPEVLVGYDTTSLRVLACSGSPLGGHLATQALDRFGPVVYNVYGSTEVAVASVAGPSDLRLAPRTAGHPARGVRVRVLDDEGRGLPSGQTGRIFVSNAMHFDGYTSGGGKEERDGLLSSGDLGHFDDSGLLYVDGRDDDMIVSGGENVYPAEVEELLAGHPAVAEVAVIGVDDEQFGEALAAFVVPKAGATTSADELRAYVRAHLARHKVPRKVIFMDALPRSATGKVLKRRLTT